MYNPTVGEWTSAYDGSDGYPGITDQLFTGLTAGQAYKFKVAASYQNGLTAESAEATIYSCA
jgi:hypothetical protein